MVTRTKDLRTGHSVWQSTRAGRVRHVPLTRHSTTAVAVIGAGITGAMIADTLAAAGLDVAVVDKREPAHGSTVASTALVLYEIDTPLITLARKIGKANAVRAWRRSRLAVDALAARLRALGVPDVARRDALYVAGDVLDRHDIAREHDARRAAGLASCLLDRKMLRAQFGIERAAALQSYDNLTLDPRKTTLALLDAAISQGAKVFAPVEIVDIDAKRAGVTLTAENGKQLRCRQLVFATGYEFPDCVPQREHKLTSTFAIATIAQPRRLWPQQCMIWEASDPYLYVRATPDGRVLCGGEDEEFFDAKTRDALLPRKAKAVQRKLGRLLPGLSTEIDFAWTGTFGATRTGLPIIGRVPGLQNCFVALGYGGNGISYARIAADIISGALSGRPDVDAGLYGFPRKS